MLTIPYRPAITAATPHVVAESALAAANGAEATIGQLSIFAGPALAALILAVGSPALAIVVNAATFAVAAASSPRRATSAAGRQPTRNVARGVRRSAGSRGWRVLRRRRGRRR